MNEEQFNMSLRKFLKKVGVTSQREIEQSVRAALEGGQLKGDEILKAKVVLTIEGMAVNETIEGDISLE